MARGYYCQKCGGTVDNNEFDYSKGMCKDCVEEIETRQTVRETASMLARGTFEQIKLEDLINVN